MRLKTPSTGRMLQLTLALAVTLVAAIPFDHGAAESLPRLWFFVAMIVGAPVNHGWAFMLAPVPFLLGANLGRMAQGPVGPGRGIYPRYEFNLMMIAMSIMGAVGILLGILLRGWIRARVWSRADGGGRQRPGGGMGHSSVWGAGSSHRVLHADRVCR